LISLVPLSGESKNSDEFFLSSWFSMNHSDSAPAALATPGCDNTVLPATSWISHCAPAVEERYTFFSYFGFEEVKHLFKLKGGDADLQV
jgi:hypothetical protein